MSDRAVDSDCLAARAEGNRRYGGADFGGWVGSLLDSLPAARVLDLCCGTGDQLVLYAQRPGLERLVGVDVSARALARARARLDAVGARAVLECVGLDDAFARPSIAGARFDLAACFYGLYYAEAPEAVLDSMIDCLAPGGAVLVVGPHGSNNAALFDLLAAHYAVPEAVLASARGFMADLVRPVIERRLALETHTFVNPVRYPDAAALLAYWRASTFYEPACEAAVARDIDAHIAAHGAFVVEKHVMAVVGRKEREP